MEEEKEPEKGADIEAVAYHEAGHAVAAYALCVAFRRVTIIQDEEAQGHVFFGSWLTQRDVDVSLDRWKERQIEKHSLVSLAGQAAAASKTGRDD